MPKCARKRCLYITPYAMPFSSASHHCMYASYSTKQLLTHKDTSNNSRVRCKGYCYASIATTSSVASLPIVQHTHYYQVIQQPLQNRWQNPLAKPLKNTHRGSSKYCSAVAKSRVRSSIFFGSVPRSSPLSM
jgi:hypothetical protein